MGLGASSGRIVLIDEPDRPTETWAGPWCRRAGYELTRRSPSPGTALDGGPIVADRGRLAADVAALNGAGTSVLVNRWPACLPGGRNAVAALRDLPRDEAVLLHAAACASALAAPLLLVHAVPVSFAERSVGLDEAVAHGRRVLDTGLALVAGKEPEVNAVTRLVRSRAHEIVTAMRSAALLVVGGPRVGTGRPLGLVAVSALHHSGCPVLLVGR
ncbi:universal stress protein [Pseudonocardia acaciae]|uniref:universal stress protein n=1 Tax=Pseudonocardia acaciae TaxID=551276 RepID=UPI00048A4813|nr:universal stress protein [Pseudonocardia acaciae]